MGVHGQESPNFLSGSCGAQGGQRKIESHTLGQDLSNSRYHKLGKILMHIPSVLYLLRLWSAKTYGRQITKASLVVG